MQKLLILLYNVVNDYIFYSLNFPSTSKGSPLYSLSYMVADRKLKMRLSGNIIESSGTTLQSRHAWINSLAFGTYTFLYVTGQVGWNFLQSFIRFLLYWGSFCSILPWYQKKTPNTMDQRDRILIICVSVNVYRSYIMYQ